MATENKLISRIMDNFTDEMLEELYRLIFSDKPNVVKSELMRTKILVPPDWYHLGTGTNRIALRKDGYVFKIALDRRGFVDNFTEFKRAIDRPDCLARAYETNRMILVSEYIIQLTEMEFMEWKPRIREKLDSLAADFIFADIGTIPKNRCNIGKRNTTGEIVFLDYGYLYPKLGNEDALKCPACGSLIDYDEDYNNFICTSARCRTVYTFMDVLRKMNNLYEAMEEESIADTTKTDKVNLDNASI